MRRALSGSVRASSAGFSTTHLDRCAKPKAGFRTGSNSATSKQTCAGARSGSESGASAQLFAWSTARSATRNSSRGNAGLAQN